MVVCEMPETSTVAWPLILIPGGIFHHWIQIIVWLYLYSYMGFCECMAQVWWVLTETGGDTPSLGAGV